MLVFIIVGKSDKPIYELELSDAKSDTVTSAAFPTPSKKDEAHLSHFVLHAALDIVDETIWKNHNMYGTFLPATPPWLTSPLLIVI